MGIKVEYEGMFPVLYRDIILCDGRETKEEEEEKKKDSSCITIKLQDERDKVLYFRIKKNAPLSLVKRAYCQHEGLGYAGLNFLFGERRIFDGHTPNELGLEEGDAIDVFSEATGGGGVGGLI